MSVISVDSRLLEVLGEALPVFVAESSSELHAAVAMATVKAIDRADSRTRARWWEEVMPAIPSMWEIEQPTPSNVPIGRIYRSWKEEGSDRPYRRNCCSSAVLIRVPRPVPLAGPALAEARR